MPSPQNTRGWRCPQCGRRFLQRTREHSCDVRSLDLHLARASDEVKHTFDKLQAILDRLGPLGIVPVKTMILGENNARLYKYDKRAALTTDRLTVAKAAYEKEGTFRSNLRYGYVVGG